MADLVGQQIGQYLIIDVLGSGGMATVYRAQQITIKRDVAIKVIETKLTTSPEFIRRFEREAQTVAALSHPHILKLFDFGNQDDLLYLVMELQLGGSLSAQLRRHGRLEAQAVATYLDQIGRALDYAHARSVVHRDLKPQNVLLDEADNAILTDFGIARITGDITRMTGSGTAMGTPSYMAPEQWYGREVDGRTDIYAMAIMAYELLAGELPFTGDTPPVLMYQHLNEPPLPLRKKRPDLPQSLERVLLKGMAKRPEARFQSAGDFAQAFREALSGRTPQGVDTDAAKRPMTPLEGTNISTATLTPLPRQQSRNRLLLVFSFLSILVSLTLLGIIVFLLNREMPIAAPESPITLVIQTAIAQNGSTSVASSATDVPTKTATSTSSKVPSLTPTVVTSSTVTITPSLTPEPTLLPEIAAQATVFAQATSVVLTAAPRLTQAAIQTATLEWVIAATAYQETLKANLAVVAATLTATHQMQSPTSILTSVATPTRTPTSTFTLTNTVTPTLSFTPTRTPTSTFTLTNTVVPTPSSTPTRMPTSVPMINIGNIDRLTVLRRLEGHMGQVTSVAWSPSGYILASGASDRTVRFWDVRSGQLLRTLVGHTGEVKSVAWSPDGRTIASGSVDRTIRLWDTATGQLLQTIEGRAGPVNTIAWSPDGRVIAVGAFDRTVRLWDAASGRLLQVFEGHASEVYSVAWSPDGRTIASGSGTTARLWDTTNGRLLRTLAGHTGSVYSVAWSPDGRSVASSSRDRTVRLWNAQTGQPLQTLTGRVLYYYTYSHSIYSVAWGPSGRLVASGSANNTVELWDTQNAQLLRTLEGHTNWVNSVAWSPDGRYLASASNDGTVRIWGIR